jgi:hypothetical protein
MPLQTDLPEPDASLLKVYRVILLFPANTPSLALVYGANATPVIDAQAARVAVATKAINRLLIRFIFIPLLVEYLL